MGARHSFLLLPRWAYPLYRHSLGCLCDQDFLRLFHNLRPEWHLLSHFIPICSFLSCPRATSRAASYCSRRTRILVRAVCIMQLPCIMLLPKELVLLWFGLSRLCFHACAYRMKPCFHVPLRLKYHHGHINIRLVPHCSSLKPVVPCVLPPEAGAVINCTTRYGCTPLYQAPPLTLVVIHDSKQALVLVAPFGVSPCNPAVFSFQQSNGSSARRVTTLSWIMARREGFHVVTKCCPNFSYHMPPPHCFPHAAPHAPLAGSTAWPWGGGQRSPST